MSNFSTTLFAIALGFAICYKLWQRKAETDAYVEQADQTPETYQYKKVITAWKNGEFDLILAWIKRSELIIILPDGRYDYEPINGELWNIFEEAGVPVYLNEYIHYTPENPAYELPVKL